MEISERIPGLTDKELESFQANALRLADSGTQKQREQAQALLPLLAAAREQRAIARTAAQAEQRQHAAERRAQARAAKAEN